MSDAPGDPDDYILTDAQWGEVSARKQRSIARLAAEGVPHLEHLPTTEPSELVTLRSIDEVARRALCLFFVSMRASEGMEAIAVEALREFGVYDDLSPLERKFIETESVSQHDAIQFSWRIEACAPLLWYLRLLDQLDPPDGDLNTTYIVDMIGDLGPEGFFDSCSSRPVAEVLDQVDLIYRYHWATRQASLNEEVWPGGLHGGAVQERHQALNWLINYDDASPWDFVTTDT